MATTIIQVRRDTAANWTSNNPILATGELGFETDTGLFKIGRNDTAWTSLDYAQVAGPAGPEGAVGLTGPAGENGYNGMNGAPGDNGLSAYEIWLNLGNGGSEQDFIDSLAGEDGVAGVDGLNGANGAAGAAGLGYDLQVPAVYAGRSAFGPLAAKVSWNPSFGTKAFVVGSRVRATLMSDPSKYVEGTLTTFNYLPDGGVEETYYGVYFYNDIDTTGYGVFDELGTFDGSDTWKISVAGEPGGSRAPEKKDISGSLTNIIITAEDMGKYIYSYAGDPVTVAIDVNPNSVPHGSQVTIIQRWNGPVTISPSASSGPIYFAETDGLTEGTVTLKGIYSAATIVNAEGFWVVIGSFGSANPYVGA
jgi:hypothetical protein